MNNKYLSRPPRTASPSSGAHAPATICSFNSLDADPKTRLRFARYDQPSFFSVSNSIIYTYTLLYRAVAARNALPEKPPIGAGSSTGAGAGSASSDAGTLTKDAASSKLKPSTAPLLPKKKNSLLKGVIVKKKPAKPSAGAATATAKESNSVKEKDTKRMDEKEAGEDGGPQKKRRVSSTKS